MVQKKVAGTKVVVGAGALTESNKVEQLAETVESWLKMLESGSKPWFLTTIDIYTVAKDSLKAIPKGQESFNMAMKALSSVSMYVSNMTNAEQVAFSTLQLHELINQLDSILSSCLMYFDDGLDVKRGQLSVVLRQLIVELIRHKDMIVKFSTEKYEQARDSAQLVYKGAVTRYEQAMVVTNAILSIAKDKYPGPYGLVETTACTSIAIVTTAAAAATTTAQGVVSCVDSTQAAVRSTVAVGVEETQALIDTTAYNTTAYVLQSVRPFVQVAAQLGTPYVQAAIAVGQPYVQPYVEATAIRAKPYLDKAQSSEMVSSRVDYYSPFVEAAIQQAQLVLELTKTYAMPSSSSSSPTSAGTAVAPSSSAAAMASVSGAFAEVSTELAKVKDHEAKKEAATVFKQSKFKAPEA